MSKVWHDLTEPMHCDKPNITLLFRYVLNTELQESFIPYELVVENHE